MTRTRTWPDPGSGTATSSMRKSVSDGSPGGRRARTTRRWVFGIIVYLSRRWAKTGVGDGLRRYRTAHSPFQATVFPATPQPALGCYSAGTQPPRPVLGRAAGAGGLLNAASCPLIGGSRWIGYRPPRRGTHRYLVCGGSVSLLPLSEC